MTAPSPSHDLLAEVELYLRWMRGAAGPLLPAAQPPPRSARRRGPSARPDAAGASGELERIADEIAACRRCVLAGTRQRTVPGQGSPEPRLVVVGEAPGAEEDVQGLAFVGKAGELLTRMLAAIGLGREDVFIANVLKCRPPGNRSPRPDEVGACRPWLDRQLEILAPPLILALGAHAARRLLATERGITSLRGRFHTTEEGWRVMPTFHPAYLLRNPAAKREAWADLKKVADALGIELPTR